MALKSERPARTGLAPNGQPWIDAETLKDVRIIRRNLSGAEVPPYNRKGDRNFGLLLPDEETALRLREIGWNVKQMKPREGEEVGNYVIDVEVKYGETRPPKVVMVTDKRKTPLSEETVGMIDAAVITKVDLTIRPYQYDFNGRVGTKAYLKTMYVTIQQDALDAEYEDIGREDDVRISEPVDEWAR
jgi:hypothetical protein